MKAIEVRDAWTALFPKEPVPAESQFALWLMMHSSEVVREAIVQLATKYRKLKGAMTADYMVRFASAVMNRLTKEAAALPARNEGVQNNDKTTTV